MSPDYGVETTIMRQELHRVIEALPDDDLVTVTRLLGGLRSLQEPTPAVSTETREERRARIDALIGSAGYPSVSVDEFLARKHEDTHREENRRHGL